jgi:hypothetical protein
MRRVMAALSWRGVVLGALALAGGGIAVAYADVRPPFAQQGSKLTASPEIGNGNLGWSAALSADGNTALVSSPSENSGLGAAWVFTRSNSTWTQQAKLANPTGETANGYFGGAVALSADGDTALIGGQQDGDTNWVGAAWVFVRSGSNWTQQGNKLQGGGRVGDGQFGAAVALSADGNTAAIGAPLDAGVGAGWIFTRSGSTWTQQGLKLTGAGAVGSPYFGRGAALSGDGNTVLFGGPIDNSQAGAAWVFTRSGSTWTPQGGKLVPTDAVGGPEFGLSPSLSADGNTALIGGGRDGYPNPVGAAWVFTRSGGVWTQQGSKLRPTDEVGNGWFGNGALSSDGNTALIGAYLDNSQTGAAWVFTRSGSSWTQQTATKLTGSDATTNAAFGYSVALSANGDTALMGGYNDNAGKGAAWVFFSPLAAPPVTPAPEPGLTPNPLAYTPKTTITSGPQGFTSSNPRFEFTSDIPGSTFECSWDGKPFEACETPTTRYKLPYGRHIFSVRAISPQGVPDPAPPRRVFTLGAETRAFRCSVDVAIEVPRSAIGAETSCDIYGACPVRSECAVTGLGIDAADVDQQGFGLALFAACRGSRSPRYCAVDYSRGQLGQTDCAVPHGVVLVFSCPHTYRASAGFEPPVGKFAAHCRFWQTDRSGSAKGHVTCTLELRIKPAAPFSLVGGSGGLISTYVPGPGVLLIGSGLGKAALAQAQSSRKPRASCLRCESRCARPASSRSR